MADMSTIGERRTRMLAELRSLLPSLVRDELQEIAALVVPRLGPGRANRIEAAARELLASLPRCAFCESIALYGGVSHEPERCGAHMSHGYRRECDWAPAARELAKLVGGEG